MPEPRRPRKFKTDEELKAFRQQNMAKARATRDEKVKKRRAPVCHPDREQVANTGLCRECYVGGEAAKKITLEDALKLATKFKDPEMLRALKDQALALLIERLPEYAQMHVEAARMAALKGDARPAEWALQTIKERGGTAVLEPPQKEAPPTGTKILIGVNLGGISETGAASNQIAASVSTSDITVLDKQ